MSNGLLSFFREPALTPVKEGALLAEIQRINPRVKGLTTEYRFYVKISAPLTPKEEAVLVWLLAETFEPEQFGTFSQIAGQVLEVGPRQGLVTPWNSNAVAACLSCGLDKVQRIERARRYALQFCAGQGLSPEEQVAVSHVLYDRMTEAVYQKPLESFESGLQPEAVKTIDLLDRGQDALVEYAKANDFAWSEVMQNYICDYFINQVKRNPTDVELFMFGQLNSNHCRHLDWNAKIVIDDLEQPFSLLQLVQSTYSSNHGPVAVAFRDNAAVLQPISVVGFMPQNPLAVSAFAQKEQQYCFVFKVETHNHPTAISPYEGAATGVAVRRDVLGVGRGGVPTFHVAGYYVGFLFIPDYRLVWEKELAPHPGRLTRPLDILIKASNGASDNANCFGNPVTFGVCRSFEGEVGDTHYGYTKCAMIAGSGGYLDGRHIEKQDPKRGMLIVQTGGPALPIGVGGGSGSSRDAGDSKEDLDWNSVQRADPVMEQCNLNVFRACSEMGEDNPICNTTDLGAGGYCVAVGELVHPAGGRVELRELPCGDTTMPVWVFWCNEAQERMALLIWADKLNVFKELCRRNGCPMYVMGEVTEDDKFVLTDKAASPQAGEEQKKPIDLSMSFMLSDLPQITLTDKKIRPKLKPCGPFYHASLSEWLSQVFALLDVGSKAFLTRKADRSVGGRIAQQQCCGPLHLTVADNTVIAASLFQTIGHALAIGEQPIKGLINSKAGARMSLAECLLNLSSVKVESLESVSLSATWQWPGGHSGETDRLYQAVSALAELCKELGVRISVGKDSMSMTAKTKKDGQPHAIKAPGTVQIMGFAPCPDITKKVTPDIKAPGQSKLMFLDLANGRQRLGASALARVQGQLGVETPDVVDPFLLRKGWEAEQYLVDHGLILASHDRSDGGLITCLLEMAFSGNCGLTLKFLDRYVGSSLDLTRFLFNEELGKVFEYLPANEAKIKAILQRHGLKGCYHIIGRTTDSDNIVVLHNRDLVMKESMAKLRSWWSETSFQLDALQANPEVVAEERKTTYKRHNPKVALTFQPRPPAPSLMLKKHKPVAAVLSEVGTNGDREMAAVLHLVGFKVLDVQMSDSSSGHYDLNGDEGAQLLVAPGGFSRGDVLDSAKAWAAVAKHNPRVADQVATFLERRNTCFLGVCNGDQFATLAGIVPWQAETMQQQPRFINNVSDIFESRLVNVQILESNSIFLSGMAGSILPVIVAHHEGRAHFPDQKILAEVLKLGLAPIRFVDDDGQVTEKYPFNPNGSPLGITGLISRNGRCLAMMPHPERTFQLWQMPYLPPQWRKLKASPWLKLFQNAYQWCVEHR